MSSDDALMSSTVVQRHVDFLQCYLGRDQDGFPTLRQYGSIGIARTSTTRSSRGQAAWSGCYATQTCFRHMSLAVEGDALYAHLLRSSQQQQQRKGKGDVALLPNARVHCLHYGNGSSSSPDACLRVVLARTTIHKGERIVVCAESVQRCEDELGWYVKHYGTSTTASTTGRSATRRHRFDLWPANLPYYHGVGERHATADPTVSFPETLLSLEPCLALGDGQLEVRAALPIPDGMCFLYGGQRVSSTPTDADTEMVIRRLAGKSSAGDPVTKASDSDVTTHPSGSVPCESYDLYVDRNASCRGQGIMRYVNHRYQFAEHGNMEVASIVIPAPMGPGLSQQSGEGVTTNGEEDKDTPSKKATHKRRVPDRVTVQDNQHFVCIPFFVASSAIDVGQPLLAESYGDVFDARLEREVMVHSHWIPFRMVAQLRSLPPVTSSLVHSHSAPCSTAEHLGVHGQFQHEADWVGHLRQRGVAPYHVMSPYYRGDYRSAVLPGEVVWRPSSAQSRDTPWSELYVVVDALPWISHEVLLQPLTSQQREKVVVEVDAVNRLLSVRWTETHISRKRNRTADAVAPSNGARTPPYDGATQATTCIRQENNVWYVCSADDVVLLHGDGSDYVDLPSPQRDERHVMFNMDRMRELSALMYQAISDGYRPGPLRDSASVPWTQLSLLWRGPANRWHASAQLKVLFDAAPLDVQGS